MKRLLVFSFRPRRAARSRVFRVLIFAAEDFSEHKLHETTRREEISRAEVLQRRALSRLWKNGFASTSRREFFLRPMSLSLSLCLPARLRRRAVRVPLPEDSRGQPEVHGVTIKTKRSAKSAENETDVCLGCCLFFLFAAAALDGRAASKKMLAVFHFFFFPSSTTDGLLLFLVD